MVKPVFSVIIPALNEEKFLPNLLESLTTQTKRNFEVIVVDGKSKDKTVSLARTYKDKLPALEVITSPKASLPLQRNLGAEKAQGEWLIFVDADSLLMPYFIDRIDTYVREEKPTVFTSWVQPDSSLHGDAIFALLANVYFEVTIQLKRPLTPGPLTGISRRVFEEVGGYDVTHTYNEDAEFGLRLSKHGYTLSVIHEALYIWSMRRIRREGKMKVMQQYVISAFPIFFLRRPMKYMPGYIMGGHLYGKKKRIKRSVLKIYEKKLKQILKELFA
jgi:glycosyltransferase involved in cell wall biosynthesis